MAKIARKNQKIFGSNLPAADLGVAVFGSFAAGAEAFSLDPETIQSLSNYLDGWSGAVEANNSPAMEDMNAIDYLYAYQLAYIFQSGIAEWNSLTNYFIGSIVTNGLGGCFISLVDNNLNHAVSDSTRWGMLSRKVAGTLASPNSVGGATAVPVAAGGQDQDVYVKGSTISWATKQASVAQAWRDTAYSPELDIFVAVSDSGTNRAMWSNDGITWTTGAANFSVAFQAVVWAPKLKLFVAVANSGTHRTMTSADGKTWSNPTDAVADAGGWLDVCWATRLGLLVAVGASGAIMTSPDAATWTSQTAAESNTLTAICWADELGMLALVSIDGTNRVQTSFNGVDWSKFAASAANLWNGIAWSPLLKIFAAVSSDGTNRIMISSTGFTWTAVSAPAVTDYLDVCWSDEMKVFVAVSQTSTNGVAYSASGTAWTAMNSSTNAGWCSVIWSKFRKKFLAVAASGTTTNLVMTFDASAITASPNIAAGFLPGQRITCIGSDDMAQPVVNGVYLKKFATATFLWDATVSDYILVANE